MAKGKYILQSPLEGVAAEVGSIIEWDEDEAAELPWAFQPAKEASASEPTVEETEGEPIGEAVGGFEEPTGDETELWPPDMDGRLSSLVEEHRLTPSVVRGLQIADLTELPGVGRATAEALKDAAGKEPTGDETEGTEED